MRSIIKKKKWNNKGQFADVLLVVITIFIIGIILLFMNHVTDNLYGHLETYLNTSEKYNESEALTALEDIHHVDNSVWDYAFLAIFIGMLIQMVLFSYATRINIAFFWIFVILAIIILIVGTILSAMWQEASSNPEFSTTITRFPITNILLGTYFPIAVTAIIFIFMIVLFGKPPQSSSQIG